MGSYNKEWFYGRGVLDDKARAERHELRKVFGILCIVGVLVGLFLGTAAAEVKAPVWETYAFPEGEGALSISDQPCSVPVAIEKWDRIRAEVALRGIDLEVKQSRLLWKGQVYAGCYAINPKEAVVNIDSKGELLLPPIPREKFVPHEGELPVGGKAT